MTPPNDDPFIPAETTAPESKASRQGQGGGPKTAFGKAASSGNATTHGLSAKLIRTLPDHFGVEVDDRLKYYVAHHQPQCDNDMDLCGQAAIAFVQHREAFREKYFHLRMRSHRAQACWELDRTADAELLGFRLAKRPGAVAAELRRSLYGARWLLERWQHLASSLEIVGLWLEDEVQLAYNLLGRDEMTRQHDPDRAAKGSLEERKALVAGQIRVLKDLVEGPLKALDDEQRRRAIEGDMFLDDPAFRRIERYGRRALKINRDCLAELERRRIARGLEAYNPDGSIASPPPGPGDPPRVEADPNYRPVFFEIPDEPTPDPRPAAEGPRPIRNEPRPSSSAPAIRDEPTEPRRRPNADQVRDRVRDAGRKSADDRKAEQHEKARSRAERKAARAARKRNR